ncbi:MAG: hypothetical protein HOK38_08045 [Flavobacteriaceae bacterium]|jgi:hypothetical protein|nr:hypothetical protein [Flavobacteriaceae bacterium]
MKATGKIGVFLFLMLFLFPFIGLLIQQVIGITEMRLTTASTLLALIAPYFFTYSKWANDNIWNTKTSKPTNTSYTSSKDVVEPIDEPVDDNHDILGNINLPSLSNPVENNNDVLQKIEELKRQIESLQASLNTNDSNKLPEEKIDYGEYEKKREKINPDDFKHKMKEDDFNFYLLLGIILLFVVVFILLLTQTYA